MENKQTKKIEIFDLFFNDYFRYHFNTYFHSFKYVKTSARTPIRLINKLSCINEGIKIHIEEKLYLS